MTPDQPNQGADSDLTALRPSEGRELMLHSLLGLLLFLALESVFEQSARLPTDVYESPVVVLEAVEYARVWPAILLSLVPFAFWKRLHWKSFEHGASARVVVVGVACALAWAFSCYSYNYFYMRLHLAGRLLVVLAGLGVALHPAFVGVFVCLAFLMAGQFEVPLRYSWTDKRILFDLLLLFDAALVVSLATRRRTMLPWIASALCLTACFYVKPGLTKLQLGWLETDRLSNLFLAAVHQNGWLQCLGHDTVTWFSGLIDQFNLPLKLFTLAVELGMFFVLVRHRLSLLLLAGAVMLHCGIFAFSGILFWKWIVADILLALALVWLPRQARAVLFNRRMALYSCACCTVLLGVYGGLPALGWYDTPLSYRYHFEVTGERSGRFQLTPAQLEPYDLPFGQARMHFLSESRQLVGCMGTTTDRQIATAVEQMASIDDLERLRERYGTPKRSLHKTEGLSSLLKRYMQAGDSEGRRLIELLPQPPPHVWSAPQRAPHQEVFRFQETPCKITIRRIDLWHSPSRERYIKERVVHQIPLPAPRRSNAELQAARQGRMRG